MRPPTTAVAVSMTGVLVTPPLDAVIARLPAEMPPRRRRPRSRPPGSTRSRSAGRRTSPHRTGRAIGQRCLGQADADLRIGWRDGDRGERCGRCHSGASWQRRRHRRRRRSRPATMPSRAAPPLPSSGPSLRADRSAGSMKSCSGPCPVSNAGGPAKSGQAKCDLHTKHLPISPPEGGRRCPTRTGIAGRHCCHTAADGVVPTQPTE